MPKLMHKISTILLRLAPWLVVLCAVLNQGLSFLSYEWNPGTDNYSYDVSGLQLVSGVFFDFFPVAYRPPFVPVLKNILYLVFEGHPYVFSLFIHSLGVVTAFLVWRLGCRLHPAVGFFAGLFWALDLRMGVVFHAVSTETFYLPLLLLSSTAFLDWLTDPDSKRKFWLCVLFTFLCVMSRTEIVVLVPLYAVVSLIYLRCWKRPLMLFCVLSVLVNAVCFCFYLKLGYWGLTNKTGWSRFIRISRKADDIFCRSKGLATSLLYACMQDWCPWGFSAQELEKAGLLSVKSDTGENIPEKLLPMLKFPLLERQMYTYDTARSRYGLVEADRLFGRAVTEAVKLERSQYLRSSFVRFLCSLHLYDDPGLRHKEYMLSRARFLFTYVDRPYEDIAEEDKWLIADWSAEKHMFFNPLAWERQVLKARFLSLIGIAGQSQYGQKIPEEFKYVFNYELMPGGAVNRISYGGGVMAERIKLSMPLDLYFHYYFWGPRFDKAYITRGKQLMETGQFKEAEEMFRRAVELDPYNPQTLVDLSNSVRELERADEADALCRRAAQIGRINSQAYIELGISARHRGDYNAAQEMFECAVKIHPHRPEIYLESGHTYLEEGNVGSAKEQFEKAVELEGARDYSLSALGLCLRRQGRDKEAEDFFRRALERNPDNFTALVELADIVQRDGNNENARSLFLRAVESEPEEESVLDGFVSAGGSRTRAQVVRSRALKALRDKRARGRKSAAAYNVSFVLEPISRIKAGLRALRFWDGYLFSLERHGRFIFPVLWFLWFLGIVLGTERRTRAFGLTFLVLVLIQAALQALFSDNYGGRFSLGVLPFYWIGGVCGARAVILSVCAKIRKRELEIKETVKIP